MRSASLAVTELSESTSAAVNVTLPPSQGTVIRSLWQEAVSWDEEVMTAPLLPEREICGSRSLCAKQNGQTERVRNMLSKADNGFVKAFENAVCLFVIAAFLQQRRRIAGFCVSIKKIKLQPKDDLKVEARFQIVFKPVLPKRPSAQCRYLRELPKHTG